MSVFLENDLWHYFDRRKRYKLTYHNYQFVLYQLPEYLFKSTVETVLNFDWRALFMIKKNQKYEEIEKQKYWLFHKRAAANSCIQKE